MSMLRALRFAVLAIAMCFSSALSADTFRVGSDPACTHSSIQAAIEAAAANGVAVDEIWIATNQAYTAQALSVIGHALNLRGGFADCEAPLPGQTPTLIDGSGNGGLPALDVDNRGGEQRTVQLVNLDLVGSDVGPGDGGVLRARGWLQMYGQSVTLRGGQAMRGGGIYIAGDAAGATAALQIGGASGSPSRIEGNQASDGGGIYCDNHAFVPITPGVRVALNTATRGGGAFAHGSCQLQSQAGGEDAGQALGIVANHALQDGGGAYADAGASLGSARYLAQHASPQIADNIAGRDGGGVYVTGAGTFFSGSDMQLRRNIAGNTETGRGGGLYVGSSASAYLNNQNDEIQCGVVDPCVEFAANRAGANGNGGSGGGFHVNGGSLSMARARLHGNQAANGAAGVVGGFQAQAFLRSNLITGHASPGSTLVAEGSAELVLVGSTMGSDTSSAAMITVSFATARLETSVVHSAGSTALVLDGPATVQTRCVLSHSNFDPAGDVRVGDPDFLNAAAGNFRLGPGSDALDACNGNSFIPDETDFAEMPRGVDLADVPDLGGFFDLGAYEQQLPLPDALFGDGFEPLP